MKKKIKKNMIAETLKDEEDKVAENNMLLLSKAFQTPESSPNQNKEDKNKKDEISKNNNEKNIKIMNKDIEIDSNIDENEYNYEVRNIDSLDGWNEW